MSKERLQKVLAHAGVASRRDCEELIAAGRVRVNGQIVREMGTRIDPVCDTVQVDEQPVELAGGRVYILLHKPVGVVSTADDPEGRETVVSLVNSPVRVFPVGRLDINSEGLLLLTNDGELTHRLTHPSFEIEKEYHVLLDQEPDAEALQSWRTGVALDDRLTAPAQIDVLRQTSAGTWMRVVLHEGRKRQVREVARVLGYTVRRLIRVREGALRLGDLPRGQWRFLHAAEVRTLRAYLEQPVPARNARAPASDRQPRRARGKHPRHSE